MDPGPWASYWPTLVRYCLVAVGLGVIMYTVYIVQVKLLGVKREAATGRALVMPWIVGFLVFQIFTTGAALYISFTEYNLFRAPQWVGLENYKELFDVEFRILDNRDQRSSQVLDGKEVLRVEIGDGGFVIGAEEEEFWRGMKLTLPYAFLTVPIGLMFSLGVALLLNQRVRGLGIWRVLYYMPAILPAVATALLWRWIFSRSGLINGLFDPIYGMMGIETPKWLTDPSLSLTVFIIISLWGVFGANTVILLAGLKGIPQDLYEAAAIDGAGEMRKFRNVTIPMLSPALFYNLVTSTIAALQVFEVAAFIETPAKAGTFLNWLIYNEAFSRIPARMGMASAMAWILLLIIVALTALVFRSSQAWVFYQGAREEGS